MNLNNRVGTSTTLGRGGIKTEAQATKKLDIPAGVTMRVSKVFRKAFVCFTDMSLFDDGPGKKFKAGPKSKRKPTTDFPDLPLDGCLYLPDGSIKRKSEVLFVCSEGLR
jgi:hypothetical protein